MEILIFFDICFKIYILTKLNLIVKAYSDLERERTTFITKMFIESNRGIFKALAKYDKRWSK